MSFTRKIRNIILSLLIILEILLLFILHIKNPFPEYMAEATTLFKNLGLIILFIFTISIICYIFEHKNYNKKEYVFDENMIAPNFDISLKNNDILYLSTILKQQYPEKKEIILLIMQLINKKVIDLSSYWDGKNYQYFIEKRATTSSQTTSIEKKLLYYFFKDSNRVDLISKIKEFYSSKSNDISLLVKEMHAYIEKLQPITASAFKPIYKIIVLFLAICIFIFGIWLLLTTSPMLTFGTSIDITIKLILLALLCIFIAFLYTIILKKFNATYQYNNDSYLWFCKNAIFIFASLIISYLFPIPFIAQFFIVAIYIFTTLTIMIKYNEHISLSQNDIIARNKLISLKNYFKNMHYLEDNYFGNIITYEECIMYGFLFNITIKIKSEFDLLQKELYNIVKKESNLYFKLFKNDIL